MEQVAIITKLVEEMIALNATEDEMAHFILNLDTAVRTLTHIKENVPRNRAWYLKREAERPAREAKEAEEKEEKRLKQEREEERKKEAQRQRRRELYQLKKAEKKAKAEAIVEVVYNFYICRYCRACEEEAMGREPPIDCFECEMEKCFHLHQAETYEEAHELSLKQFP